MPNFDVLRTRSALAVIVAIFISMGAWFFFGNPSIALVILCGIAIMAPFQAVRLYWENDSMIGGLPRANYSYNIGLVVLALGNITTCIGFFYPMKDRPELLVVLGSVLLLIGIGILVGASSLLFKHIIRRGLKSA